VKPLDRDADPVAQPLQPQTSFDASLLTALEAATTRLATATDRLESANADYRATKNSLEQARSLAATARERAHDARQVARTSAQQLLLAVRHEAASAGELGAMFGHGGGTLLQRLGTADRVGKLGADPHRLAAKAQRDARVADRLADDARAAQARADGIQLGPAQATRDEAQRAVDEATAALDAAEAGLQQATQSAFTASYATPADGAEWVDPVRGPITDVFGDRPSRPAGTGEFHPGVDIGASCGTWMVAAADGVVVQAGPYSGYGNFLRIDHGGGVETAYGHIMDGGIAVQVGEHVSAGQPIARVGSTGMSTGCHLHLEVRVNGNQINPQPFFALRGVVVGG
jgi:murein DD-endopeptidase MepM/ murein hydrolase activator NlpD